MITFGLFARNFILVCLLVLPASVSAETATGTGKTSSDAITGILRSAVDRSVNGDGELIRGILNEEVVPSASRFVQSYRIVPGNSSGGIQVSADIDVSNLRALFSWNLKSTASQDSRILLVSDPLTIPSAKKVKELRAGVPDPNKIIDSLASSFLRRRGFLPEVVHADRSVGDPGIDNQAVGEEKLASPGKVGTRFQLSIRNRIDLVENENSHSKDDRFFLIAELMDTKDGRIVSKATNSFHSPSSYKEQYYSDLYALVASETRDLLLDLFIDAGRKYLNSGELEDFFVVRVVNPSNMALLQKFRAKVQESKEVKSILEYHFARGAFDYALRPEQNKQSILKWIQSITSEDFELKATTEGAAEPDLVKKPELFLRIVPLAKNSVTSSMGGIGGEGFPIEQTRSGLSAPTSTLKGKK